MAAPATTPSTPPRGLGQSFETVLRGYDRTQVDEFVVATKKDLARLTSELTDAHRQRRLATEHAEATEVELRELRARSAHVEPKAVEDSFGYRAEKLLRMAEQEAAEARTSATREASTIVEQARTEAEKHRHQAEQAMISRASLLEQQASQRTAELQEREQQIADQLATAREQAEQLHATATRAADSLRQESEAAAEQTRQRARAEARREHDQAAQEITRLTARQADVRAEMARLIEVLSAELSKNPPTGPAQRGTARTDTVPPKQPSGNDRRQTR